MYGIGNGGTNPGNLLLTPSRIDGGGFNGGARGVQIYPGNVNISTNMALNMGDSSGVSHAVIPANSKGMKGSVGGGQYTQMTDSTAAMSAVPMWNSDLSLGKSGVKTDGAGNVTIPNGASYSMSDRNGNKLGWTVQSGDGNMVLYNTDASGNRYGVLSIYTGVNSSSNTLYANVPMVLSNGSTVTTQPVGDASSRIATDSFVATAIGNASGLHLSSSFASTPAQCFGGYFATGVTDTGAANCAQVGAAQLTAGALPNGTTATTQTQGNSSTKLATTAYVDTGLSTKASTTATTTVNGQSCALGSSCNGNYTSGTLTSGNLPQVSDTATGKLTDSGIAASKVRTTGGGQTITAADTLSGMPTGCVQAPCLVFGGTTGSVTVTSPTSGATYTTAYTPSVAGDYQVSNQCVVTSGTGNSGGTLMSSWQFYAASGQQYQWNGASLSTQTMGLSNGATNMIHAIAGQPIQYGISFSSVTGSVTYKCDFNLQFLKAQ
jgi:hypothetical protein